VGGDWGDGGPGGRGRSRIVSEGVGEAGIAGPGGKDEDGQVPLYPAADGCCPIRALHEGDRPGAPEPRDGEIIYLDTQSTWLGRSLMVCAARQVNVRVAFAERKKEVKAIGADVSARLKAELVQVCG
jgi:hypothetical protein